MAVTKAKFSAYIKAFQFRELFNDMGWNNDRTRQPIIVDNTAFNLSGIAEKSGFRIFTCMPTVGGKLPDAVMRKKIEAKVTKLFQEHLIIFIDEHKREQVWQLAVRQAGSPTKISETRFTLLQDPELLYQRASGLFFTLDEEERVTIIDVTRRVAENFQQNNERVTKKFYEGFKKEHTAFLNFIKGIDDRLADNDNQQKKWYASLMLNRLMFCYFIQKQRFLDDNKDYLRDKLRACQEKKGRDKFYSFYRDFLLALFHKGLGTMGHDEKLEVEIGRIPYLNGGLFDKHEIEEKYLDIQIEDAAFGRLFNFFDQYEWHLDTRETASGKDINPDVMGYIFEKYINDQAQMGAYYTKEDITDYISKNCIIPWLFDEVKRQYPGAFANDGWLWQMVKNSGDDYIYDAVKHGVPEKELATDKHGLTQINIDEETRIARIDTNDNSRLFADLPEEIRRGFVPELEKKVVDGNGPWLWELRKDWNKPAPSDIALPTEIYREVIERRKRYAEIRDKIVSGEVKEINDFITYNLNICQFVQDVIETIDDAKFVHHFYKALSSITILDPTCGSGAFLFAAMNILEPLYETCIQRMKDFVSESSKGKHQSFEKTLTQVNAPEHPSLQYFIYKSIILNNLYGVDIMNEAVEIAKLRLFLKLVATVGADYNKPNLGLEPLPDVDFNIRAGNTLVGYATKKQIDGIAGLFVTDAHRKKILEQCDIVARAFTRYKEIQLSNDDDYEGFKQAKDELNERLKKLTDDLDGILYMAQYLGHTLEGKDYQNWLTTHQPFHWFAEFYEIIAGKEGFDVVIGNPPYVEYSKVKSEYTVQEYKTESCGNLYAFVVERNESLLSKEGSTGMIVPHSAVCTDRMGQIINVLGNSTLWVSTYDIRPAKLFIGVDQRLAIYLKRKSERIATYCTKYYRWNEETRDALFSQLQYTQTGDFKYKNSLPKAGQEIERKTWYNICSQKLLAENLRGQVKLYFHNSPRYWIRAMTFVPYFWNERGGEQMSTHIKSLYLTGNLDASVVAAVLNSSLFYWWFVLLSNCRDLVMREIETFPIGLDRMSEETKNTLVKLTDNLMADYKRHAVRKETEYEATGGVVYDEFYPRYSKPIIDQIDSLLAQHYGFTHEELDFIINYDIKYRMGRELCNEEEI